MRLSDRSVSKLMAPSALDILTVIPHDEILTLGFEYLRQKIQDCEDDMAQFEMYLHYFKSTWMSQYSPNDWNISGQIDNQLIANRTNNALESYNRHLNDLFTHPHPNIMDFVERLRHDSEQYFRDYQDCQEGLVLPPRHRSSFVPDSAIISEDYRNFRMLHFSVGVATNAPAGHDFSNRL